MKLDIRKALISIFCSVALAPAVCGAQTADDPQPGNTLVARPAAGATEAIGAGTSLLPGSIDPQRSAEMDLLRRSDIAAELKLTTKQRDLLAPVIEGYTAGLRKATQSPYAVLTQEQRARLTQQDLSGLQERSSQAASAFILQTEVKIKNTLKPDQAIRLKQLDLQWRTPMGLITPALSAQFKLGPDQSSALGDELRSYRTECGQLVQKAYQEWRNQTEPAQRAAPQARKSPPVQPGIDKLLASLKPELESMRKSHGTHALSILTAEQQDRWAEAVGVHFEFHDNR